VIETVLGARWEELEIFVAKDSPRSVGARIRIAASDTSSPPDLTTTGNRVPEATEGDHWKLIRV